MLKKHIHVIHEGHKDCKGYKCGLVSEGHKYYQCKVCGKSFTKSALDRHFNTVHEGRKDYKCVSCGKSFSDPGYLKKHSRKIHEGHEDYKCESCGKSFSAAGSLKKHIHTIHGLKNYQEHKIMSKKVLL